MAGKQNRPRDLKRLAAWRDKEAQIRRLIEKDRVEFSSHVFDKIATNYWNFDDVVNALMTGSISNIDKDELGNAVDGNKYTMLGDDCYGNRLETVGKIVQDDDGRLYFLVTAY